VNLGASDWFKKATMIGYARISDEQQDKASKKEKDPLKKPILIAQKNEVNEALKRSKLPQAKEWFMEVESGTKRDRPAWLKLQSRVKELVAKGKRVVVVVKDPSRWSRNARHGMRVIDDLHELGVPVYASNAGIQTGSVGDLHPTEELLFIQLTGSGAFVSQVQKEKADRSVDVSKELGIMAGKGTSLFPFAEKDPVTLTEANLYRLSLPKKEGGWSNQQFYDTISLQTQPHGISPQGVKNEIKRIQTRRKNLNEEEYQAWTEYRQKIRNLLIEAEHDPFARTTKEGAINWPVRALMRMVGRYLSEPEKYRQRSDEEIQEILDDFPTYLSGKDADKYRAIVGKRGRRR